MLPVVGAEVENKIKDSLYLRCKVGRFDVAESEFVLLLKSGKIGMIRKFIIGNQCKVNKVFASNVRLHGSKNEM